jgi:hypothetical protein
MKLMIMIVFLAAAEALLGCAEAVEVADGVWKSGE